MQIYLIQMPAEPYNSGIFESDFHKVKLIINSFTINYLNYY
jgi:hypothetical protein